MGNANIIILLILINLVGLSMITVNILLYTTTAAAKITLMNKKQANFAKYINFLQSPCNYL